MKKLLCTILAFCLMISLCSALALESGDACTVIGADNSTADVESVYSTFGIERGSVPELTITNADERSYLEGQVADSALGTRAISCVYIEVLPEGKGLEAEVHNVTVCTREMYIGALTTAGISDAKIIVVSPVSGVSGTAALAGIFVAYEDMSGEKLDTTATDVAVEELTTTADLADDVGGEKAAEIVNDLKSALDETKDMTDEQLRDEVASVADKQGVSLTDEQIQKLIDLVRSLENLDIDQLTEKAKELEDFFSRATDSAGGIFQAIADFLGQAKDYIVKAFDYISSLF